MIQEMNNLLATAGMSNSLNKPASRSCPHCGNDKPQIQIVHPFTKDLRWVHCACPCETQKIKEFNDKQAQYDKNVRIKRSLKLSSSLEEIREMRFQNYRPRTGTESSREEVIAAVTNFEERGRLGIFIFGETGNGKSHLTAAGGNELIARGKAVIFLTEKDLFSRLQATKNFNNKESFQEILGACLEADLLIWDDFMSSQKLSADEKDWLFQIVNGRERANRPIWYTSNITPEEFTNDATPYKLDDKGRTWWRIIGNSTCIHNRASNHRKVFATARMQNMTVEQYEGVQQR